MLFLKIKKMINLFMKNMILVLIKRQILDTNENIESQLYNKVLYNVVVHSTDNTELTTN